LAMDSLGTTLDVANRIAMAAILILVIALAARGVRRTRRWPLALVAVSLLLYAAVLAYDAVYVGMHWWNETPYDMDELGRMVEQSIRIVTIAAALLAVGLGLEVSTLMRNLNRPTRDGASLPSAGEK
jgi:hypothetical protein